MQVAGYISTSPEPRTAEGQSFSQFRLAVLSGRGDYRKTDWFTVRAQLSELDADLLEKGQRVEVTGVLSLRPYLTRDSKPGVDAVITTRSVVQAPPKPVMTMAPTESAPTESAATVAPAAPLRPAVSPPPAHQDAVSAVLRPTVEIAEEEPLPF